MKLNNKLVRTLLITPLIAISLQSQGQTKKYLEKLKTDTTNHKISINIEADKQKRDSLIKKINKKQNYKKYFYKAELRKAEFRVLYDSLIMHDKFSSAEQIIMGKLKDKELTETVTGEKKFYEKYKQDLEQRLIEADVELKKLIDKKRLFKKKFKEITKNKNLETYLEANELTTRCINYGKRTETTITNHIIKYDNYSRAKIIDEHHKEDLEKSSRKKRFFLKTIKPYEESENLNEYIKGLNYLDTLTLFITTAKSKKTKLKRKQLVQERYKLQRLIDQEEEYLNYDKTTKEGNKYGVQEFRSDTANPEGIFVFGEKILVIKTFNTQYNADFLILGDGKQLTDKMLVRYADQNDNSDKHSKANERVKGGKAIPYFVDGELRKIYSGWQGYQIRITYDMIRNKRFTEELKSTLRPVNLDTNYRGLVNDYYNIDKHLQFYRNKEGSFVRISDKDSTIIISEYNDDNSRNTENEDHIIDRLRIIEHKKHKKPKSTTYKFNINDGIDEKNIDLFKKYQHIFNEEYNRARKNFHKTQK